MRFLQCKVSILQHFEEGLKWLDWEIGVHGIIIEFMDPMGRRTYNATYLPEIAKEQGWTKEECIDSLMLKAGFTGTVTSKLRESICLTRYQSSCFAMDYDDYIVWKNHAR